MDGLYNIKVSEKELKVTRVELQEYKDSLKFHEKFSSRISEFFLLDLYIYEQEFYLDPKCIINEIEKLEGLQPSTITKPAAKFNRSPLAGLWHKHYYSSQFLPINLQNAYTSKAVEKIFNEVFGSDEDVLITQEIANTLASKVSYKPILDRLDNQKVTGEWIVFAVEEEQNYYLCLGTHNQSDEHVADKIKGNCIRDFQFLEKYFT